MVYRHLEMRALGILDEGSPGGSEDVTSSQSLAQGTNAKVSRLKNIVNKRLDYSFKKLLQSNVRLSHMEKCFGLQTKAQKFTIKKTCFQQWVLFSKISRSNRQRFLQVFFRLQRHKLRLGFNKIKNFKNGGVGFSKGMEPLCKVLCRVQKGQLVGVMGR